MYQEIWLRTVLQKETGDAEKRLNELDQQLAGEVNQRTEGLAATKASLGASACKRPWSIVWL
jgi:hypothetical protein